MHVLMTVPHRGVHGPIAKLTPLMAHGLRELGAEVTETPYSRRLATQAQEEPILHKIADRTGDLRVLISKIRQNHPDILFANTTQDWNSLLRDIPMALAARAFRIPTVLLYHGSCSDLLDEKRFLRLVTKLLLSLTEGLLLLSQEEVSPFKQHWPDHHYAVIQYPVLINNSAVSSLPSALPELWYQEEAPILLFVGRLVPPKGIQEVIEALPEVLEWTPCRLAVLGEGELYDPLQKRVHELGLERVVHFAGYVSDGKEMYAWYNTATCLVLPTYWREGFPVAVLEAMSAGLPIVCTRLRGLADHLQEGANALFVPPRDPHILAVRLIELLNNKPMRLEMSRANRELIRQFCPVKVMQRYLDFFEQVLDENTVN